LDAAVQEAKALNAANPNTTVQIEPAAQIRQYNGTMAASGLINLYMARAGVTDPTYAGPGGVAIADMLDNNGTGRSFLAATGAKDYLQDNSSFQPTPNSWNDTLGMYDVPGRVTFDFQNRLGFTTLNTAPTAGAVVEEYWANSSSIFVLHGTNDAVRNVSEMAAPNTAVYVGAAAVNASVENSKIWTPPDTQGPGQTGSRRGVVIVGGAQNTAVRNNLFQDLAGGAAAVSFLPGLASANVSNVTVDRNTFALVDVGGGGNRNGTHQSNFYAGIANSEMSPSAGMTTGTINNLVVTNNTFRDWGANTVSTAMILTKGTFTNMQVSGNLFTQTVRQGILALQFSFSSGSNNIVERNTFYMTQPAVPNNGNNLNVWIRDLFPVGATPGLTIRYNLFSGGGTSPQVVLGNADGNGSDVTVPFYGNTMSGVGGEPTAQWESRGSFENNIQNAGNHLIRTAWPSLASISGTCQIGITINAPPPDTDPNAFGYMPGDTTATPGIQYPYYVDAFAGRDAAHGGDGMGLETYLGQVTINSPADEGKSFNFSGYTGAGNGMVVRLETIDKLGRSSQYSRIATASGNDACAPALWIQKGGAQEDPTSNRFIHFDILSSEPLAGAGLTPGSIFFTGTAPGSQVVSLTQTSPTTWLLVAKANGTGTVEPMIGANAVTDMAGLPNAAANTAPVPLNFARHTDGSQMSGPELIHTVTYINPLSVSPLQVTAPEGGPNPTFTVSMLTDPATLLPKAQAAPLFFNPSWSNLILDPAYPSVPETASTVATLLATNPAVSSTTPTMNPGQASVNVPVQADDNTIVDGTRHVTLGLAVTSTDPEFDGLLLPNIAVTILDNDRGGGGGTPPPNYVMDCSLIYGLDGLPAGSNNVNSVYRIYTFPPSGATQPITDLTKVQDVNVSVVPNFNEQMDGLSALGIDQTTGVAWMVTTPMFGPVTVLSVDLATGVTTPHPVSLALPPAVNGQDFTYKFISSGAVSPTDGIYYFGGFYQKARDPNTNVYTLSPEYIYGYNVHTNTLLNGGKALAAVTIPTGNFTNTSGYLSYGDFVFDNGGNLYLAGYDALSILPAAVFAPAAAVTGGSAAIPMTSSLVTNLDFSINAIALDRDGYLYGSDASNRNGLTTGGLKKMSPGDGRTRSTSKYFNYVNPVNPADTYIDSTISDFASCASPGSITVQKNLPSGRASSTDQFTLSLKDGSLPPNTNTATTSGSSSGVQSVQVGPIPAMGGADYTVGETGAGVTNLAGYSSSWVCVNNSTSPPTPILNASGNTTGGTFKMPSPVGYNGVPVVCTITNSPLKGELSLAKNTIQDPSPGGHAILSDGHGNYATDVNDDGKIGAGDKIFYAFDVKNTGPISISGIAVNDTLLGGQAPPISVTCPQPTLAAGASETCAAAAAYVITQANVDTGSVTNTATASGTASGSAVTSDPSDVTVFLYQSASLSLTKTVDAPLLSAGQNITYTLTATNTGTVSLTGVLIFEGSSTGVFTGTGSLSGLACTQPTTLAPGQKLVCKATYTVTAADVAAGKVQNFAQAIGLPASGPMVTAEASITTATAAPSRLPALGGSGTTKYAVIGGLLVLLGALAWLAPPRRRKGVHAAS
jgi:uncharacterized repeat protein (TIGR01451 family)